MDQMRMEQERLEHDEDLERAKQIMDEKWQEVEKVIYF